MGKTTDSLIALAHEVSPQPDGRELDMLLSTGERISCALVAMAIHDLGYEAVSFTGSQAGIVTDDAHGRAKIREIRAQRVVHALDAGKIVLVAGFQGVSTDTNDVTTLGRGGTDATAVALAAALGAACEIYSDVAGVYTSDPRVVPGARKLPRISYEEMLEMSASGAKVLMLRSVELARNHNVRVHSRSTFSQEEGTWIVPAEEVMEHPIISGVTHSQSEVIFTLTGIPDRPGAAATVFDCRRRRARQRRHDHPERRARRRRAVVLGAARGRARHAARAGIRADASLGPMEVEEDDDMGKVSLIGAGMRSHPGVAARMFRTLADLGINLRMISTSPIKISCMIARDEMPTAVRALHDAFELETPPDGGGLSMARLAILGATGAVGTTLLRVLEERAFPLDELRLLASERSAGAVAPLRRRARSTVQAVGPAQLRRRRHRDLLGRRDALARVGAAGRRGAARSSSTTRRRSAWTTACRSSSPT